ncbi:MAG: hypothetical protein EZS28_023129 [Streblomastix strix]|uniref:HNH nuclease domain-containing protein n=1 Tax=Streblomastix strix TaxID=222440 RepID=A0A5J4VFW8_9EUKA|nr:MAG: hypothetical protein EZS28_023129 [Streblomastix strix]
MTENLEQSEQTELIDINEWQVLKYDNDFEIRYDDEDDDEQPWRIRRIRDKFEPSIILDNNYYRSHIKEKHVFIHRLVALQYITNPNPLKYNEVDHKNRNSKDNHINNLRCKKKGGALFVSVTDVDNKRRRIYLNKFKKIRDLD